MQLIWFAGDGSPPTPLALDAPMPAQGFGWLDVAREQPSAQWVERVRALTGHTVLDNHISDAEHLGHRSVFESTAHYDLLILRALAAEVSQQPQASQRQAQWLQVPTQPLAFLIFGPLLVTVRSGTDPLFNEHPLRRAGSVQPRQPGSPEDLLLRLANASVDRYLALRQPLTDLLDAWQRQLLDPRTTDADWLALFEARSALRKLQNLCEDQRDAIQEWRDDRLEQGIDEVQRVRLNDLFEHVERVTSHARRMEASLESAVQLHFAATAHRTNQAMRTLTALSAVFMPLTLITGIFGMNFDFIPGLHSREGLLATMAFMAALGLALIWWFARRRYLDWRSFDAAWRQRHQTSDAPSQDK